MIFSNLEDYVNGMSNPSWHQWLSYETELLNKEQIIKLINDSIEHNINLMEKYGICNRSDAERMRFYLEMDKKATEMINSIKSIKKKDKGERLKVIKSFEGFFNTSLALDL